MIKIPEKYIRSISWINILFGSYFIVAGILGLLTTYFDLAPVPKVSSISLWDYALGTVAPALLLLSGYSLLNTNKKVKYKDHIAWLFIVIGFIFLVFYVLSISILSILQLADEIEFTKNSLLVNLIIYTSLYLTLVVSGFYLRKISR